jgi:DNA polymerase elongation subunit (family B)
MIVSTQLRDSLNIQGDATKQLVLSYINNEGTISYLTYDIPINQLYTWKYAKRGDAIDPIYKSWDFKSVKREPSNGYLSDQRIHEILLDLIEANPNINVINELHIPKTYFCDIEVDVDDSGFPDAEHALNPINTISWVCNDQVYVFGRKILTGEQIAWIQTKINEHCKDFKTEYKFTYICHENEIELLQDFFMNYVKDAPCITGWNFFGYDWPYLYNRCVNLGIDISWLSPTNNWYTYKPQSAQLGTTINLPKHKLLYDYMEIYVKWDRAVEIKESNKLDWVAETVVGAKKVEHVLGFAEEWRQKPSEYIFYNAIDSILVREIDNKIKTSSAFFGLANLMHVDALTAFSPVRSLEIVQTEYLYKEHRVFPITNKKKEKSDDSYEGAFVFEPKAGIYKNVIALDFASLYPTTMRQFNISPDTYIKKDVNYKPMNYEIKCVSGAVYQRDFEGFIPKILTDFYMQRKSYKKEMMIAIDEKYHLEDIYEKRFGKTIAE